MNPSRHIPTPEQQALDAAAAAHRAKMQAKGQAQEAEQLSSVVAPVPEAVPCLSDLLPAAVTVFERLQEKAEAFFAEIRPKVFAAQQTIPCGEHPSIGRSIDFDLTCKATREQGRFTPAYALCVVCVRQEEDERRRAFWSRRGVPARVIDASFRNFDTTGPEDKAQALATVKAWYRRRGNFLLLVGTTGTGKGHLAAACLRSQGAGLWIEHVNMLGDLRASYTLHTTSDLIATWQSAEMLVLDEFGLSPGGKDEEPMLYQVLADRYDKRRPTIITSNLDRPQLREAIGFRLLDRIREDCVEVRMQWGSWRTERKP